jgi:DNA-binding beta-propeller fold protein YncE
VYLVDSPWHLTAGECLLYGFDPSTNITPTVLANCRSGFCAITPNGKHLLLGPGAETVDHKSRNDLVMIDLTNNKLTTLSTEVKDVGPIAIAPNGNDAYVISGFHSRNNIPSHINVVAIPQN